MAKIAHNQSQGAAFALYDLEDWTFDSTGCRSRAAGGGLRGHGRFHVQSEQFLRADRFVGPDPAFRVRSCESLLGLGHAPG